MKARPYQIDGLTKCRESYATGHSAPLYCLATGGGKSFVMGTVAKGVAKRNRRSTIIAHRRELILQMSLTLARQGIYHSVIGPDSVIRDSIKFQIQDHGRSFYNSDAPTSCSSVQTLIARTVDPFDFILGDECHHFLVENSWGKALAASPNAKVLGVTATTQRLDGKALGKQWGGVFDDLIVGPDTGELMDDGYLTYADVWGVSEDEAPDFSEISNFESSDGRSQAANVIKKRSITGNAIKHYSAICPFAPAIVFCTDVEHARQTADQFCEAGYRFQSIDGKMSDGERMAAIRGLGDGRLHGLTSCNIVNEGTDIPVVTVAILLRPTDSLTMHKQQLGRVLRPVYAKGFDLDTREGRFMAIAASNKPRAIILDHVGNCERLGFPDDPYTPSLEGFTRKKGATREVIPKGRTCANRTCNAIFRPTLPACPACGTPAELNRREIEYKEGELVKIERDRAEAARRSEYWNNRRAQAEAKSKDDLIKLYLAQGMSYPKAKARANYITAARKSKEGKADKPPQLIGI